MASSKQIFWHQHLDKALSSGLTIKAYCKQNELSAASMYHWRRRIAKQDNPAEGFDEVEVLEEAAPPFLIDLYALDHSVLCRIVQAVVGQCHA